MALCGEVSLLSGFWKRKPGAALEAWDGGKRGVPPTLGALEAQCVWAFQQLCPVTVVLVTFSMSVMFILPV